MQFGVVVLAAGQSTRMGSPKLLLQWRAKSLLRRAVETAAESGAAERVVVLGDRADELAREVPRHLARVVVNPDFARGQSTSLRRGLSALSPEIEAAVCFPADQPFVTAAVIRRLVEAHALTGKPIVVAEAGGVRGAPLFLVRGLFAEAMSVQGDQGARALLRSLPELVHVEHFDDPDLMLDVDTPEDYAALTARAPAPPPSARPPGGGDSTPVPGERPPRVGGAAGARVQHG